MYISCRSSFVLINQNDNNLLLIYMYVPTLRDRTDGRSAGNPHVSKACNCLVSQTKQPARGLAHWLKCFYHASYIAPCVYILQVCSSSNFCPCYLAMY